MNATESGTPAAPIPVVVHLSGARRGTTEQVEGDTLRIGTSAEAEIRLPADEVACAAAVYATLERRGLTYELHAMPGLSVWVNGEATQHLVLASGDLIEIGKGGPVLRFRVYAPGTAPHKSLAEAFSDCLDCARYGGRTSLERAAIFLAAMPRELATQTSPRLRAGTAALLALLALSLVLAVRSVVLERRLAQDALQVRGIAALLDRSADRAVGPAGLAELRNQVAAAAARLEALEARSGAGARVVAAATRSTALIQGAYGFVETATGRPLRLVPGPDGEPLRNAAGDPAVSLEGEGPILEVYVIGTAFRATEGGLLLTNRHVAEPWVGDGVTPALAERGVLPVMRRFVGYFPGTREPCDIELVLASDDADLAVLRCRGTAPRVPALRLASEAPRPGDELVLLGYAAGIDALLVRTDAAVRERLLRREGLSFWTVVERLAAAGQIAPLASRGIVGQVTREAVVYDAASTSGASGGPVLDMDGAVIAVNRAILTSLGGSSFGGSNLGVPADRARALLARARSRQQVRRDASAPLRQP